MNWSLAKSCSREAQFETGWISWFQEMGQEFDAFKELPQPDWRPRVHSEFESRSPIIFGTTYGILDPPLFHSSKTSVYDNSAA